MSTSHFTNHKYSRTRRILVLAILSALLASGWPGLTQAQSGGTPVVGTITAINSSRGDQIDPHISGTLVTYASIVDGTSTVHYYDLLTGTDNTIPAMGGLDFLPDIHGTTVVYTHLTSGAYDIDLFDAGTGGAPVMLDPQPASLREKPDIGSQTVAWVDYGVNPEPYSPEVVAYDRTAGVTTRLTDDLQFDMDPNVSPDGSLIVWTKCETYASNCRIWQASRNGSGWDIMQLQGSAEQITPTTDGQIIVYTGYRANDSSTVNIFWQPPGGGEEHEIALPGSQRNPTVDDGVVVFESFDAAASIPNWDIMLFDIETGVVYELTDTTEDEVLSDLAVGPDRMVHVVWTHISLTTGGDIYASTFHLPDAGNQPPVIDTLTGPLDPVMLNTMVSLTGDFHDPDPSDTHTAAWDWGDGSSEAGTVSESSGAGTANGARAYATPGVYTVTLSVTDSHDATDTAQFQYVVAYDPAGGFVTGAGWIDSPAGAYALDPSLTGRAHFGFVSRYKKGATLPGGDTEFQFKAGDLSFRSTSYDWLVIAGARAQFKGAGTVSGSGDYGFLLTAIDGQITGGNNVDKFRIKIWDLVSGLVVYDNQIGVEENVDPVMAIGGGAIVIHK